MRGDPSSPLPAMTRTHTRRAWPLAAVSATLFAAPLAAQTPAAALTAGLGARTIGSAAMSGRFVDLAVYNAQPHVFYAASSTGGLYKTLNSGTTWTPLFGDQPVQDRKSVV